MAFMQIETRPAGTVTQREVLQITLTSLITDRTIERMIDQ